MSPRAGELGGGQASYFDGPCASGWALTRPADRIRYACFLRQGYFGTRYAYVVIDRERDERFECGFEIPPGVGPGTRAELARETERDLWRGIKERSPGTFLDAGRLGYLVRPS